MKEDTEKPLAYFEIDRDMTQSRRWWLDIPRLKSGEIVNPWMFSAGRPLSFASELLIPIEKTGDPMDVTFSHCFVCYIQPRVGRVLEAFASSNVQRVSAQLQSGDDLEILNTLTVLDCFDRERSQATYKGKDPNMVMRLRINAERAEGHHIFRLKGWLGPLIISGLILEQLRRIGVTGFVATKVS